MGKYHNGHLLPSGSAPQSIPEAKLRSTRAFFNFSLYPRLLILWSGHFVKLTSFGIGIKVDTDETFGSSPVLYLLFIKQIGLEYFVACSLEGSKSRRVTSLVLKHCCFKDV